MGKFIICGGRPIGGQISVSGAKNAALPMLAASLLTEDKVTLSRVPRLSDTDVMCDILSHLGCCVDWGQNTVTVHSAGLSGTHIPFALTGRLRGSFLVMGPLLARRGRVSIALPGGCSIGARPVDLHLKGFLAMGAEIDCRQGTITASANRLHGADIYLDFPSVGATENILCAAALADGITHIENAAAEPEIADLATLLTSMGADICGAGTDSITVCGKESLSGAVHSVMPDRIEAGTFLLAGALSRADVTVQNVVPEHLKPITAKLCEMGVPMEVAPSCVTVHPAEHLMAVDVKTLPHPGFPTDLQAPMAALLSGSEGLGMVTETVFENRFLYAPELCRMGAAIKVSGRSAAVWGRPRLEGARTRATDLRAGAALVIAALAARGDTEISDIYHIDRGYEKLDEKLRALGAEIHRI